MTATELDAADRAIIRATQSGLPLVPRPYDEIAREALRLGAMKLPVQTRIVAKEDW